MGRPSRRCANLSYGLYNLSLNLFALGCFQKLDLILIRLVAHSKHRRGKKPLGSSTVNDNSNCKRASLEMPSVYRGVQSSMLFIFLIANLGTGAIKLLSPTNTMSMLWGILVIIIYTLAVFGVAFVLGFKGWKVKFW